MAGPTPRLLPTDRVAVAVATTGTTAEECRAQALAAIRAGADVVELRADLLTGRPRVAAITDLAAELASLPDAPPLLVTVRTAAEGGGARLDDDAYRDLLRALAEGLGAVGALGEAAPAALDVELARGGTGELVGAAHAAGLEAVVSSHDFAGTPDDAVMLGLLRDMAAVGADVAKLAVMPGDAADVARLLGVTARAHEELAIPVVTMSMGELGVVSRVAGAVFGSAMTFATAGGAPSAPGQLPVERVRGAMDLFPAPAPGRRIVTFCVRTGAGT